MVRIGLLCAVAALLLAAPAAAEDPIGHVKTAEGEAFRVADARAPIAIGDPVFTRDVLETGADGSLGVTFVDGSTIALGPNSSLALDEYQFDSAAFDGSFLASLNQGTLVMSTGDIARTDEDAVRVATPDAILGVRGTTFAVKVEPRS
jgi:hypothetical protein